MLEPLARHLKSQRWTMMRFGVVGVLATAVHFCVALASQSVLGRPLLANLIGFLAAFGVSFGGHSLWTFKISGGWWRAARRLLLVSGLSFVFSTVALAASVSSGVISPLLSLAGSVLVIPIGNYALAKLWAFA